MPTFCVDVSERYVDEPDVVGEAKTCIAIIRNKYAIRQKDKEICRRVEGLCKVYRVLHNSVGWYNLPWGANFASILSEFMRDRLG